MPIIGLPSVSDAQLFPLTNLTIPAWLLLAFAPRSRLTVAAVHLASFVQGLLYIMLVVNLLLHHDFLSDFQKMGSYEGLQEVFKKPSVVLPCWLHYTCFDLWVGKWINEDAARRNVPVLLRIPTLFLTLMLGPTGLVLHLLVRGKLDKAKRA